MIVFVHTKEGLMSLYKTILTCSVALALTTPALAYQDKLDANQDSYAYSGKKSTNYASDSSLFIKKSNSGSADREAYIEFDISSLEEGVDSLYFRAGILSDSSVKLSVYSLDENWRDTDLTWKTNLDEGDYLTWVPDVKNNYLMIDVSERVNEYLAAGKKSITFALRSAVVTTSPMEIASHENSSSWKRPRLYFDKPESIDPFSFGIDYADTEKGYYSGRTLTDAPAAGNEKTSTYGGWLNWNLGGTGVYRTEQVDGAWFLVDPDGYVFYSMALNSVTQGGGVDLPGELKDMGLNSTGSWSDQDLGDIARTPRWNFLVNFKNTDNETKELYEADILPVFYPEFVEFADEWAESLTADKDDPFILGHFSDNELPFHKEQLAANLNLASSNPQYIAANAWMIGRYGNSYDANDISTVDEEEFSGYVAETYFRIVSAAIKKYDPNHLYIGSRIHAAGKRNPYIIAAAGKYVDVMSINFYGEWEPESGDEGMGLWNDLGNKPFLITEFYTKAEDSGLANSDGAGWLVASQEDRAIFYENFALKLMENPGSVGWHWFRYMDNNDSNKGMVDENYNWYETLRSSFSKINHNAYELRGHLMWDSIDYNGLANGDNGLETQQVTPSPVEALANIATISASSDDGNSPNNVVDDDLGSRWSAKGEGESITFKLEESIEVSRVDIAFYKGDKRTNYVEIQVSQDGSNWQTLFDGGQPQSTIELQTFSVDKTSAKYLRIIGHKNSANNWNSLTEVDIYGF